MQATQFSPGMKLQMSHLRNPEIVAVRKHFNIREIVLFLLFCFHVTYTEEEKKKEKRKKPTSFYELDITFSGKVYLREEFSFLC